jgi:glycosyltransferase involved in cell wall biosynthesis
MILMGLALIVTGIVAVMAIWMSVVAMRFLGTLEHYPLPAEPPSVTTIVPARNEQRNIARCVRGLTQQIYPNLRMVFVDDASEDATGDILARGAAKDDRITVINTGGKPDDWNGKHYACFSGAQLAESKWLCFMDADTLAEPQCLERTVAFAEARGLDMLSLQPWYELHGLWERIMLPLSVAPIMLIYPPGKVNDPTHPLSMANGQFILIRRSVYDAVDGHRAVKDRMMDDFPLAENVKGAGYRLMIVEGFDVMRVRLFANLREIWGSALKAAVAITGGWRPTIIALIMNTIVNVLPPILLIIAVLTGNTPAIIILSLLMVAQLLYYGISRMMVHRIPPWSAVMFPIAGVLISAMLLDGMIRVVRGGRILWKGRDVLGPPSLKQR